MTLGWVVLGTIGQLMLAYMGFLGAVFGGGAAVGRAGGLTGFQNGLLTGAIYGLPALSVLVALLVITLYWADYGPWAFAWHLLPVVTLVLYVWYVFHWLGD